MPSMPSWMSSFGRNPDTGSIDQQISQYQQAIAALQGAQAHPAVQRLKDQQLRNAQGQLAQLQQQRQSMVAGGRNLRFADLYGQAEKVADPTGLNAYFNTAAGNLSQRQGQASGQARSAAAAMAAARGMLNPSGFVTGAASQASQPYAQAFGNLEASRAQGLQAQQQAYLDILAQLNQAFTGQENVDREFALRQQMQQASQDMANRQFEMQKAAQTPGALDWLSVFLGPAATLGSAYLNSQSGQQSGPDWRTRQAFGLSPMGYQSPF